MANTITNAEIYVNTFMGLSEMAYKENSKSMILNRPGMIGAYDAEVKTVKLRNLTTSGNLNYDRDTGYKMGSVNNTWESYTVSIERSVKLPLDILDGMQAMQLNIQQVADYYLKQQDIPEVDAVAFQKIASGAGTKVEADIVTTGSSTSDVVSLFEAGLSTLRDNEIGITEQKIIFANPDVVSLYRKQMFGKLSLANNVNGIAVNGLYYGDCPIVEVPKSRFWDTVTLLNTGAGGYSIPNGAKQLNFMIVTLSAAAVFNAYVGMRYLDYRYSETADNNLLMGRRHYDAFVIKGKSKGVYVHKAATAKA